MAAQKTRLRLADDFEDTIARAELSKAAIARVAKLSASTIKALISPQNYPGRTGELRRTTAWKIVRAYAQAASQIERREVTEDEAWQRLIVEEPISEESDQPESN